MRKYFPLLVVVGIASMVVPTLAQGTELAATPSAADHTLTLSEAVQLAIQNNLSTRLAKARTEAARAQAMQTAAALLPKVLASMSQSRVFKINLAAEGFPPNSTLVPELLGPYDVFDARVQLVEDLLNFNAIWKHQAGRTQVKLADHEENLAKEQVATATSLAYLEALQSDLAVRAAQADLQLADNLFTLAKDQHKAGLSTGVDLARADTRVTEENLRLIRTQVAAQEAMLRLKRVVGLPLSQGVNLTDSLTDTPESFPYEDDAVAAGLRDRIEIEIIEEQWQADHYQWLAAQGERLPTLQATADYGFSGNLPDGSARTGSIGGRLSLPIFTGGLISGQVREAAARLQESEERRRDMRAQVEEDVRLALQTLAAEIQEVKTAKQDVELSQRELNMARDQFASGVGDNIQVLEAETALTTARDAQVDALARYNTARVNLAMALGKMQTFRL